ncbi:hypothetical protein PP899_gp44 [Agrobacterium phage Atu_ph08]|uniref:Uncharacterized protein n=1 Tax=Agrobacterium phage Atu_ph08 TaxID=2024265 RepID=A0A2L0V0X4_9CAUD|nr:hypothetical protein PP899_gp44 [Agrobacterium phage Atu_ph08]AUZ95472.1 hypothetical protein [Agrobacterium phage Atu_ph08]
MVEAYEDDYGYWKVGCGACGSHSGTLHPNHKPDAKRLVIESWNRRPDVDELRAQLAIVLEDRARFPDKPDTIGTMINAHYGNLKAKAETAEEHCRRLHLEKTVGVREARRQALELAAGTHETRVTEIRNDPASYKNGKITKSAKRASDFHERSAQAILALQSEDN